MPRMIGENRLYREAEHQRRLWTPAQMDLELWLDAADVSTLTINNSAVSQWNDKSGKGRNATQTTSANRPAYGSRFINGIAVPDFDGSNDFLNLPDNTIPSGSSAFHFHFVIVYDGGTYTLIWSGLVPPALNRNNNFSVGFDNSNISVASWWWLNDLGSAGAGKLSSLGTPVMVAGEWASSSKDFLYKNGELVKTGSRTGRNSGTGNNRIGARADTVLDAFDGLIAEAVVTKSVLSQHQRWRLEGYSAHKWGLVNSLYGDHPFLTRPPMVDD